MHALKKRGDIYHRKSYLDFYETPSVLGGLLVAAACIGGGQSHFLVQVTARGNTGWEYRSKLGNINVVFQY